MQAPYVNEAGGDRGVGNELFPTKVDVLVVLVMHVNLRAFIKRRGHVKE